MRDPERLYYNHMSDRPFSQAIENHVKFIWLKRFLKWKGKKL
jgi:hypothetical protein